MAGGQQPPHGETTWIVRPDLGFFAVAAPVGQWPTGAAFALAAAAQALSQSGPSSHATLEPRHCAKLRAAILGADTEWAARVRSDDRLRGVGAAFAGILLDTDRVAVGHAGDCRVYQIRQERFIRRTIDHGVSDARDRRVIVRGIGLGSKPEVVSWDTLPGDLFLLTAGVHDLVSDDELLVALAKSTSRHAIEAILDLAMSRGATDYQTILLVPPASEAVG